MLTFIFDLDSVKRTSVTDICIKTSKVIYIMFHKMEDGVFLPVTSPNMLDF